MQFMVSFIFHSVMAEMPSTHMRSLLFIYFSFFDLED